MSLTFSSILFSGLIFSSTLVLAAPVTPLTVPARLAQKLKSFEPSAAVYLEDLDRYLISSDDTTKNDDPWLFLVDSQGQVEEEPVVVQGVDEMTDIESLSQDEKGFLYILGSQSLNKKGKDLPERNLFIQARRQGRNIKAMNKVELRPLILKALQKSKDPRIKILQPDLEELLDIESHFVYKGNLIVGLKGPQPLTGQALVLNLGPISSLFQPSALQQVQVLWALNFGALSQRPDLLSDIRVVGTMVLMTTTTEEGDGRLWSYSPSTEKLSLLRSYKTLRPEGLAYVPSRQELTVFFDQGEEAAVFQTEKLQLRNRTNFQRLNHGSF